MNLTKLNHQSRYVTFRLARNLIGIDILDIREIIPHIKITKVHQAPEFVSGLINLRGQTLIVLDIGILLGFEKRHIHSDSHIIIFKHKNVGFIVDQVNDVVSADQKYIDSIPANIEPGIQRYMENIVNLPEEILIILNADKILSYTQTRHETSEGYL
jgi:purine-binding chemotaxis protein CheW